VTARDLAIPWLDRRTLLATPLALAACGREAKSEPQGEVASLKAVAPFPIGCSVMTGHLQDPGFAGLVERHVGQLTPEWEMKMEYIVQPDGTFRFDAPDAIAAFARDRRLRLFGHALVWYAQDSVAFQRVANDRAAFANAYRNYILAVAGRYRGQASGWDVVNEPISEEGEGLRSSLWSRTLGETDHIVRAFDHAAEADPGAVLFLNDYNLESRPKKRAMFMRLVETLLKRGCKLGGLGTQSHIDIDLPKGALGAALKDLASFGLPVHLSELDISTNMKRVDLRPAQDRLKLQADTAREAAEAFMMVPPGQRFAFTLWGLRDKDSWLRGPAGTGPADMPSMFDDQGQAKPALYALAETFRG
jgi:endo-1,4-beta-xylanase